MDLYAPQFAARGHCHQSGIDKYATENFDIQSIW